MSVPAIQESAKSAPQRDATRKPKAAPTPRSPNYATHEDTMKAFEQIMEKDAKVFRHLADA